MAAGIAAVVLALAIVWLLFVPAADWLAHHDVGSAKGTALQTARDAARGRLLTLAAGLLAAGALLYTARNFTLSREGQVTGRYTKAIEQPRIREARRAYRRHLRPRTRHPRLRKRPPPTVMEVLTAFIREHAHEPWPPPDPDGREQERSTRPDVQAAVTVVGRRDAKRDIQPIDLASADLTTAVLGGADLSTGAILRGAILADADFTGARWPEDVPVPKVG